MQNLETRLEAVEDELKKVSSEVDFLLFNSINSPVAHAHLISAQLKAEEGRKVIETLKANWLINEMLPERYVRDQLVLAELAVQAVKEQLKKADDAPWHSLRVTLILALLGLLGAAFVFAH